MNISPLSGGSEHRGVTDCILQLEYSIFTIAAVKCMHPLYSVHFHLGQRKQGAGMARHLIRRLVTENWLQIISRHSAMLLLVWFRRRQATCQLSSDFLLVLGDSVLTCCNRIHSLCPANLQCITHPQHRHHIHSVSFALWTSIRYELSSPSEYSELRCVCCRGLIDSRRENSDKQRSYRAAVGALSQEQPGCEGVRGVHVGWWRKSS